MGVNGTAAAGAAIADGIKAVQHGIFKKSVVHVAALFLCFQDFYCLLLTDPPGFFRMVFDNKTGKRFTDDQADVIGLAGIF